MKFMIREATEEDFPAVLSLIKELAEYEKASDKVINSVEQMKKEKDFFQCYVVENEWKEIIYRNECLKHKMQLAPGAVELLSYLKAYSIPMAIATASGKSNVDFFINKLNLLDYFAEEYIIHNDGNIKGKPHPDIFEKAIDKLGVNYNDSIIFEDSFSGIQAAINCKVANIIIVNSTKENYSEFKFPIIEHFDEFGRNILSCSYMEKFKPF